jgi:hypothetical protein
VARAGCPNQGRQRACCATGQRGVGATALSTSFRRFIVQVHSTTHRVAGHDARDAQHVPRLVRRAPGAGWIRSRDREPATPPILERGERHQ